jgi:GDPmannose 4,6-dehydratase
MKPSAIISGISGQDGAYLAQFLLKKNFKVHGILRNKSINNLNRLEFLKIKNKINLIKQDLLNQSKINIILKKIRPNLFFNFASESFITYDNPLYTNQINNHAVINILEAIRNFSKNTRFYQASSSEMFGLNKSNHKILNENSHFNPVSPYAIAKLASYNYVRMYRNSFNIFASNGILFNHESPLRGEKFASKKIVKALTEIKYKKKKNSLKLGNIYSKRNWGHAEDYVKVMYKILKYHKPDDFIISSEKKYSIKEFINKVCNKLNMSIKWSGKGLKEKALYKDRIIIEISKNS